jgi:hypothetical protein
VGWLDARLPYACELLNACSGSTMILPVSCALLAWAAQRPHLGYWLGTALAARRPRRSQQGTRAVRRAQSMTISGFGIAAPLLDDPLRKVTIRI